MNFRPIRVCGLPLFSIIFLSIWSSLAPSGALAEGVQSGLPRGSCVTARCRDLVAEFSYVVNIGKEIYCYWDLKKKETGTDFDARADLFAQSITDQTNPTDYFFLLKQWAALFHDGHVNALMKVDLSDLQLYTSPVRLELLAPATDHEQLIVSEVKDIDQVQVGDVILKVNGVDSAVAVDAQEAWVSGSTKRMRRYFGARKIIDALGAKQGATPLRLLIQRGSAQAFEVSLPRIAEVSPKPDPSSSSAPESTGMDVIKQPLIQDGLAYIRIDGFSGTQDRQLFQEIMQSVSQSRGILIDLRKNGGGDLSGDVITSYLITKPTVRYRVSERKSYFVMASRPDIYQWLGANYADWHDRMVYPVAPSERYLDKPVVVLIGPNCFSACDTFVSGLKANGLATIVGEATGGGTGTPLVFDLESSQFQFRYSVVRGATPDGTWIEGVGTMPDVLLERTLNERILKKDIQLAGALEVLLKKVSPLETLLPEPFKPMSQVYTQKLADEFVRYSQSLGPVWAQGLELSPTRTEERSILHLAGADEL